MRERGAAERVLALSWARLEKRERERERKKERERERGRGKGVREEKRRDSNEGGEGGPR